MGLLKLVLPLKLVKGLCSKVSEHTTMKVKILNVAEKNDAAKNIASILSRANSRRREGFSPYNKIYEFESMVLGQLTHMVMTSVSGHLLNYEFTAAFRNWQTYNPVVLFEAPVVKSCPEDYQNIKRTLEREILSCQSLIIWTDCDREGENIGFEIIKVCNDVKPNLTIYRAKFSEITATSVFRALNNLVQPNKNVSDAVDVRQELDLRTGAAFTRLQTLRFQKVFPQKLADKLISYGSCQFPTLGFVVERYQALEDFVQETFWKIKMNHVVDEIRTDFIWGRNRVFDRNTCLAILDILQESPTATIQDVVSKPKSKWRPLPLDTVELEKMVSRKLGLTAKEAMKIAEKLYTNGFISYPRTETNIFPQGLNLTPLVEEQCNDNRWGAFAQRVLDEGGPNPRQGRKSDQAHPPIHPTKYTNTLDGNEKRVYEYIVRHFLASVSKDAVGQETIVRATIGEENFTAKGLMIIQKNYLDVYTYERWNAKEIYHYQNRFTFIPTELDISESQTTPPKLLTEADLITLMERHGIGTDATHAEHIETIKSREYVGLHENIYFVPGTLGMGLVEGYNNIGLEVSLAKPNLRADFENDLKLICDGLKDPEVVKREQIQKYKEVFQIVAEKMRHIDQSLEHRLQNRAQEVEGLGTGEDFKPVLKCPKCGNDMILRNRKNGEGKFCSCVGYPACKNAIWLPTMIIDTIDVLDDTCPTCGPNVKLLKIKFKQNPFPGDPNPNTCCIGGCDSVVLETFDIAPSSVRRSLTNNQPLAAIVTNIQTNSTQRGPTNQSNTLISNMQTLIRPNNRGTLGTLAVPRNNRNESNETNTNGTRNWRNNGNRSNETNINGNANSSNNGNRPNGDSGYNSIGNQGANGWTIGVINTNVNNINEMVVCQCNQGAVQLTVRKDGPNKGRKFYKCADGGCNFFQWDDQNTMNVTNAIANPQQGNNAIMCDCAMPAVQRTVSKEGPNTGRHFYCCSKPMGQGCKFFTWADEVANNGGGDGFDGGGPGGPNWRGGGGPGTSNWRGAGGSGGSNRGGRRSTGTNSKPKWKTKRKPTTLSQPQQRKTRKCGNCGEEGHTRVNCPNR